MREVQIGENESGQRLDKFLQKYLREASRGFVYKMLRKKNIKLNGRRAEGSEILSQGDHVTLYFSEDTFLKFRGEVKVPCYPAKELEILYEDSHIALINKPAGMLSQKSKDSDNSLVEYFLGYLQRRGQWQPGCGFTPGICNRLDRNTSGIVIAGKSLPALQKMSELLRQRALDKYYVTIVSGVMENPATIRGYLYKEEKTNKAYIFREDGPGRSYIETAYEPLAVDGSHTLLSVKLVTGKTHQIRSHLSSIGHPLMGDMKYGGEPLPGRRGYLLHAREVRFPELPAPFGGISGSAFVAPFPPEFVNMKEKFFGEDGMQ